MDHCLSHKTPFFNSLRPVESLPSRVKASTFSSRSSIRENPLKSPGNYCGGISLIGGRAYQGRRAGLAVVAATNYSDCGGGLNTPVQPKSVAGKLLGSVLQNDPEYFPQVVKKQLEQLVVDRHEALARINLSSASDEACLHRRIAELKERECQAAAEDIIYMLICAKFYEIRVHLVPRLSKCMCYGRLEIVPSKDWELESIHSFEALEMIREHLNTFVGWRTNSNVTNKWALTQISRFQLCQVYTASVLYGYFLKSASLRHTLEKKWFRNNFDLGLNVGSCLPVLNNFPLGSKQAEVGRVMSVRSTSVGEVPCNQGRKQETLKGYIMGFDPETFQMCAKPRSKEAANVIEQQISELFHDGKTGLLQNKELISTSYASLKRFVLEGIAFGSFLWDAEEFVNTVYELKDNKTD
ncbi:OLC1v1006685C1 [Oldenlandia corymbosa var. corymbosa]|uniref:OLC1v1006685C1 n=1 Tax=Oldenlandia corymbosa var. corymbosa TaxID=529605 RepID=A0AAV1DHL3_OLDCO|nr:OLC1v1006685C1 [Oldenlandia corymbosa var. corymbosa]